MKDLLLDRRKYLSPLTEFIITMVCLMLPMGNSYGKVFVNAVILTVTDVLTLRLPVKRMGDMIVKFRWNNEAPEVAG